MGLVCTVAPTIEPVTLAEAKAHLRIDSGTFADEIVSTVTLAPDAYSVTPTYGIIGTGIDRLNKRTLIQISVGSVGSGATLDAKIQESADNSSWTDWSGGAFTQIIASGTYEKQYTGIKQYVRLVCTVAVNPIDFGASVITGLYQTDEDTYIGTLITAAREICEDIQHRSYINRTYEYSIDYFPEEGITIDLPMSPVSSITSIIYYDTNNIATTWSATEYQVDTTGFVCRIKPAYGYDWPSTTLREMAGVKITYVAGYGATAASVPTKNKQAMLLLIAELYENRENSDKMQPFEVPFGVKMLLGLNKVYSI